MRCYMFVRCSVMGFCKFNFKHTHTHTHTHVQPQIIVFLAQLHTDALKFMQEEWMVDVDGSLQLEPYRYTRVPVMVYGDIDVPAHVVQPLPDDAAGCACAPVAATTTAATGTQASAVSAATGPSSSSSSSSTTTAISSSGNSSSALPNASDMVQKRMYVCAFHAKSKFVQGGERLWRGNDTDRQTYIQKAVRNRRRLITECRQLRRCLDRFVFKVSQNEERRTKWRWMAFLIRKMKRWRETMYAECSLPFLGSHHRRSRIRWCSCRVTLMTVRK